MKKRCLIALLILSTTAQAQVNFTQVEYGGNSIPFNACTVDMNGDYLDDIVTVSSNMLNIYKQLPEGGFSANSYTVIGLGQGYLSPDWSIAAGDYDANGFTDLVFGNGGRVSVIKANYNGTGYTSVLYPQDIFTQRTNFIDIDNDGNLDLFACHDLDQSHSYRNDGNGNLLFDLTLMPTLDVGGNYASIWTDYNNDGLQDMYLSKCRGGAPPTDPQLINLLYKNNGDGTFSEVGAIAGVNDNAQSWSTAIEDFDNDGDMDFIVANISTANRFYQNNGDGTFTNIYATSGLPVEVGSWEVMSADFNNDGWADIIWNNGNKLYLNNGNNTFTANTSIVDCTSGGFGDLNNDGFMDVQFGNTVYYNDGNANKWIKIALQGVESNRSAIGARVEIYGAWGKQIRDIRSGTGFAYMSTLNAHFGIGSATAIEKVIVRWPSGMVDVVLTPSTNSTLFLLEGSSPLGISLPNITKFSISPNPTKDLITFHFEKGETQPKYAQIFDMSGRKVLSATISKQQLSTQKLSKGTYTILLTDPEGKQYTQKFIKE